MCRLRGRGKLAWGSLLRLILPQVFHEDLSKFLTAWICNFPASQNGKRRRPRTSAHSASSSALPNGDRRKRACSIRRAPGIAPPDSNLDDYAQQSREAMDELIKREAEKIAQRQAALEQKRAEREEHRQRKLAQQLAKMEKRRAAKLVRQVAHYYASEDEGEEDGGLGSPRPASHPHAGGVLPSSAGSPRVHGMQRPVTKADAAIMSAGALHAGFRVVKRNRWGREIDKKPSRKKGGARKLLDSMMQKLSGGKDHRDAKWAAAARLAGKMPHDARAHAAGKRPMYVSAGERGDRLEKAVEEMERAVQGARADRGQHKKYVGARVEVKVRGQWRPAAVSSHLLSGSKRYSIMLDDGTRLDLKIPHDRVRMTLTRAPLTTVTDEEREFARLANLRRSGDQDEGSLGLESLVATESVGCRARVLYDMGNWHCGWLVSYRKILEGSSSGSSRYMFRLQMDDNDFEEVMLPSPDGDVEIIPGFRSKFHDALMLRPGASILEAIAYRSRLGKKEAGGGGGEEEGPARRAADESAGEDNGGEHGLGAGRSGRGSQPGGLEQNPVERGGGSAWNRFLIQKKGLGLNQTQLKTLYRAQMQSKDMLRARNARMVGAPGRVAPRDRFLQKMSRSFGKNSVFGRKGPGVFNRGGLVKGARARDGRKDSSWNFFLGQHKGLGLTRGELKSMYYKSGGEALHERPLGGSRDFGDSNAGVREPDNVREFGLSAAQDGGVSGSASGKEASTGAHGVKAAAGATSELDPEKSRTAWNRFMKSKRGLGLNRTQLKALYRKQVFLLRSRNAAAKAHRGPIARGRGGREMGAGSSIPSRRDSQTHASGGGR